MKALRSPRTSGSDTDHTVRRAAALLPLILFVICFPVGHPVAAEEPIAAVWKVKEVSFSYRSSIAIYSCSALQDRVASILRAIGARDDLDVRVTNCETSDIPPVMPSQQSRNGNAWGIPSDNLSNRRTDRTQWVNVRARLMMPTEVTPEVLAEIDKDKSRRELVSRVTGNPAAKLNDPIVFQAQRQAVTLSHRSIGLEPEECELLDQISSGVFRELGVRVVRRRLTCDHNRVSRIPPELTVEAFMGIPFGTSTAPQTPAAGDPDPSAPASDTKPSEPATDVPQTNSPPSR